MNEFLHNFFGWPTLVLLLIPVVIMIRIFVRTSRWSIFKVSGVAVFGTLVSSAWLFYASFITGINLGGEWGKAVGQWLADKVGDSWAFYLLSTGLLVWFIAASLSLIIFGARYFINKPYIREIIVEVEKRRSNSRPSEQQQEPKGAGGEF